MEMENRRHFTARPVGETLPDLQWYQQEHDRNFHQDVFERPVNDQIKHIMFHVAKISGRLADYCDKLDHGESEQATVIAQELKDRRAPDLLIFALMLANRLEIDLRDSYFNRIEAGEKSRCK